jgi:tetratricopeptide (TPR) repeat protein
MATAVSCPTEEILLGFFDGDISAERRAETESHLSECDECREALSAMARLLVPTPSGQPIGALAAGWTWAAGTRVGRFVVTGVLGRGGMGVVYAADDPELDRAVALKVLRADVSGEVDDLERRLRREAIAMARVSHPAVVTIYDVGVHEGCVFLAMERIAGETLAEWLARGPGWREVLDRFIAAGRGLAAAHAAGLVHRDFKPENVLLDAGGKPRVADFGVARSSASASDRDAATGTDRDLSLTSTGALVGTPVYMSPEQLDGEPATPRSDQFSFFVALHAGLTGERPFTGSSIAELRASIGRGVQVETWDETGVLARLRPIVVRGLAVEPADRWDSLDQALDALEAAVRPRSRRTLFATAALVIAVVAVVAVWSSRSAHQPCGGGDALAETWSPELRIALARGFIATEAPYAADAAVRASAALDDYADRWQRMRRQACEATRVDGHQSDEQLGLRTRCLTRRRRSMAAVVARLVEASPGAVERSIDAVRGLPEIDACADLEALAARVPPPIDTDSRRQVDELESRLSEVESHHAAGAYPRGLELADPLVAAAAALGYRPLEGEALYARARLRSELGDHTGERADLENAVLAAVAGRDDRIAALAAIELVITVGHRQSDIAATPPLLRQAAAAVERAGDPDELTARLDRARAITAWGRGDSAAAKATFEALLARAEERHGPTALELLVPLRGLAAVASQRMDGAALIDINSRALAIQRRHLGDDHPDVATTLGQLGYGQYLGGRFDEALASFSNAIARRERALGPDHVDVAGLLDNVSVVYAFLGRSAEATRTARRAADILRRGLGAKHRRTLASMIGLAQLLEVEERYDEANQILDETLEQLAAVYGSDHPLTVSALTTRGLVELGQSQPASALETLLAAQAMERRLDPGQGGAGELARLIGQAYLALARPREAVEPLERAHAILAAATAKGDGAQRLRVESQLARALYDSGVDRARGRRLALEVERQMRDDQRLGLMHETLVRWLAARRIPRAASEASAP